MTTHAKGTVLLAFSGGLDTTFCAAWLQSEGWKVATVTVDTGGFDAPELARIEALAASFGAEHRTVDAKARLFDGTLRFLLFGNVLRGQTYPLSVSAERLCQAQVVAELAKELGVDAIAHGSTGAGNDQVRFDVAFRALAPEVEILAPVRSLGWSRAQETAFLAERGIEVPAKTSAYSVNEGLWGASVGGRETLDSWSALPDAAYPGGAVDAAPPPMTLTLAFERGLPVALDGQALQPVTLIETLNTLGRAYGLGRGVHLGDTILGIKGRVGFEAPAALLLIQAHRELEKLVLSGPQLFWKEQLGQLYGAMLHEGKAFDPLVKDLEAFLASSQARVTGEARLSLFPRAAAVEGVRSPHSLMDPKVASYGEENKLWSGAEAAAFGKVFGVSQLLSAKAGASS
ncbi:MAG TPA: argininosuccinate synthase [Holophagaceae bacterium]|jgi:argininosuccinate synthase|nr:argininosuccinate synthase [Holophagaceae bacterium]